MYGAILDRSPDGRAFDTRHSDFIRHCRSTEIPSYLPRFLKLPKKDVLVASSADVTTGSV